jgi:futalosine hydrolase
MNDTNLPVLVMTAVEAEREAVMRGLQGDERFEVRICGVGPAMAAARTAAALCAREYGLVISAGIGGGFPGRAEVGALVVSDEVIAPELGAETLDGFQSVDELGFGSARVPVAVSFAARWTEAMTAAGLPVVLGPALTVSTATGTAATAAERAARVPGAASEGMEGYGVAVASQDRGVPVLELRAISNPVGPRDRAAWRIGEALGRLEEASAILLEVLG